MPDAVSAIVLAGGQSRRMGTDKAVLRLPSGGPTLIERVVAAAWAAGVAEVLVVAGDAGHLPALDVRFVPDEQRGAGPLAGLATGLAVMQSGTALALACDLPYLAVPLLQWMIVQPRAGWDALVPLLPAEDGKEGWQPLHALYTRACLAPIRATLAAGERRLTAFFPHVRVRALSVDVMCLYDSPLRSTCSINTPEAWTEAVRWLTMRDAAILPQ